MCRICGRVVKCIFDTMPSRMMHHVPSRRAFTTLRHTTSHIPSTATVPKTPSLTRAFSALTIKPTSTTITSISTRPSLLAKSSFAARTSLPSQSTSKSQAFSTSAALEAKRDTYDPSRRVQKRRHGFLSRLRSANGRATLKRRRLKGRKALAW